MKYKNKYEWENNGVIEFLNNIYNNSINGLEEKDYLFNYKYINITMNFIEDYLEEINKNYHSYLDSVLVSLSTIKEIAFVEPISLMTISKKRIKLNECICHDDSLISLKQKVFLVLTKNILNIRNNMSDNFVMENSTSCKDSVMANNGWLFLEDMLTKEIAGRLISNCSDTSEVRDNLELDQLLCLFGLTLDNVGTLLDYSKEKIRYDLTKKALDGNFTEKVINEYEDRGKKKELFASLYLMGSIYNVLNKRHPDRLSKDSVLVEKEYYKNISSLTNLLSTLVNFDEGRDTTLRLIK